MIYIHGNTIHIYFKQKRWKCDKRVESRSFLRLSSHVEVHKITYSVLSLIVVVRNAHVDLSGAVAAFFRDFGAGI